MEAQLRKEIIRIGHMLHQKNFIAATDGNISVRLGERLLVTPSGVNKGFLEEEAIILVDLQGATLKGRGRCTSEIQMHLLAYQLRPGTGAVVHAHPPSATACSLAGISLLEPILPEVVLTLKGIPTAPYATPTTGEVPASIQEWLGQYDALILERHGAVTVGRDLQDAYNKMEKLEHTARVVLMARLLGEVAPLPPAEVDKLLKLASVCHPQE